MRESYSAIAFWRPRSESREKRMHSNCACGPENVERVARKVPEPLNRILDRALRAHPDDRYQSGGEMRDELRVHLGAALRQARLKRELSQADVADRVGVTTYRKE